MAYSKEDKEKILNEIFDKIDNGVSTRKAILNANISSQTFWKWLDEDEQLSKQYARAKEIGIEVKFESIEEDYSETPQRDAESGKIDMGWVQLQRLKIDAKKWELSKLHPKKYGDKLDVTSKGDAINTPSVVNVQIIKPED